MWIPGFLYNGAPHGYVNTDHLLRVGPYKLQVDKWAIEGYFENGDIRLSDLSYPTMKMAMEEIEIMTGNWNVGRS